MYIYITYCHVLSYTMIFQMRVINKTKNTIKEQQTITNYQILLKAGKAEEESEESEDDEFDLSKSPSTMTKTMEILRNQVMARGELPLEYMKVETITDEINSFVLKMNSGLSLTRYCLVFFLYILYFSVYILYIYIVYS